MRQYLLTCELSLEDLTNEPLIEQLGTRLDSLRPPPGVVVRIPIQWDDNTSAMTEPQKYLRVFECLFKHASLMIEFADSAAMAQLTPEMYRKHVRDCLQVLGRFCAVGEAGNEINAGNWHEPTKPHPHQPEEVVQMVQSAIDECAGHLQTAITFYLAADENPFMLQWMQQYAANLKSDLALVSHYPNTGSFSDTRMEQIWTGFSRQAQATKIGWGEYGTEDAEGHNSATMAERAALIRKMEQHYWGLLSPKSTKYVGLGGYWDWKADKELDKLFKEVWGISHEERPENLSLNTRKAKKWWQFWKT